MRSVLNLHLPSPPTIYRWTPVKKLQPGNNECVFLALRNAVNLMNDKDKVCVMSLGEMAIRHNLTYNSAMDIVDGVVDLGHQRTKEIGGQVCTFMLRGLFSNWKFVFKYIVTENSISSDELCPIILENVGIVQKLGLDLRAISSDQGPNNRKSFNFLAGVGQKEKETRPVLNFEHDGKKIYLLYDVPHLLKSLRNSFMNGDFETPDGIVSFSVIREVYELEKGKITKMTNFRAEHIYPSPFDKMKVKLAAEVFSHTTASAIKTCVEQNYFKKVDAEIAKSTGKFVEKMNILFDCLNSKNLLDPNPYKRGLKKNNCAWLKLIEMKDY